MLADMALQFVPSSAGPRFELNNRPRWTDRPCGRELNLNTPVFSRWRECPRSTTHQAAPRSRRTAEANSPYPLSRKRLACTLSKNDNMYGIELAIIKPTLQLYECALVAQHWALIRLAPHAEYAPWMFPLPPNHFEQHRFCPVNQSHKKNC